ncbi:uncharacterized protein K444DRAFT_325409 [Hyaloscypha bicolor E]|uniref:Uncharacterized protein n=1 Tax=Hyaloscypha bicolor E TaxID=1095630 RepID=A0A2J6TL11_9HELO|nr:uncharacterized protein K444DRAFT_325409 [Hyaloscypha bicolor E]PMD63682.1 hypothetical protein K444DRAFT_325409 [Hyaloscypha bicolor E]
MRNRAIQQGAGPARSWRASCISLSTLSTCLPAVEPPKDLAPGQMSNMVLDSRWGSWRSQAPAGIMVPQTYFEGSTSQFLELSLPRLTPQPCGPTGDPNFRLE